LWLVEYTHRSRKYENPEAGACDAPLEKFREVFKLKFILYFYILFCCSLLPIVAIVELNNEKYFPLPSTFGSEHVVPCRFEGNGKYRCVATA
jgi:hypothetical protein